MPSSILTKTVHPQRARPLTAAALVSGILVAGCGGSSPGPTAATVGGARTSESTPARTGSTVPGVYGSGPLGFARCMRANGVPSFRDPTPGSVGCVPVQNNPAAPAFQAAQTRCEKLVPGSGPPGSGRPPSAQTLAKLLKIARCMRRHGVPHFPDPQASVPSNLSPGGFQEITDFDGAILTFPVTINLQAPAYRQALTACGAPPLGLPH
jgi:hypothetical protein